MKNKIIHINYSQSKTPVIDGSRLDNVIDWDLYYMEQWRRHNPETFQMLVQSTITPRIGKMIITGTNPDESTNSFKDLFIMGVDPYIEDGTGSMGAKIHADGTIKYFPKLKEDDSTS